MALSSAPSSFNSIPEYNEYLANNLINLTIKEYTIKLNELFYKQDFSHIDFFMEIVGKDEICIHHDKLIEYGIITTNNKSSNISRMLDQYEFKIEEDYRLLNVEQPVPQGGYVNKKEYILHPRVFKFCLMRAKNTTRFSKYYLTIEEIVKYYGDYQYLYKTKLYNNSLALKDGKIDELTRDIKELLNRSDKVLNELTVTNTKLTNVEEELTVTNTKLDTVLEDRVMFPNVPMGQLQTFVLLKLEDSKYKIIYGSNKHINSEIKKIKSIEFTNLQEKRTNKLSKKLSEEDKLLAIKIINKTITDQLLINYTVLKLEKVPNTYYLRKLIVEKLSGVKIVNTTITLIDKTEEDMVNDVENIYEERKKQDS